jgi:hypothetical protein
MTPMIDIVFQLILFFLFNLRFKSVDFRIDAMLPKDRGPDLTPPLVDLVPRVQADLFRVDGEDPVRARTKVKIGAQTWVLPPLVAPQAERDAVLATIAGRIRALVAATGQPGTIGTPAPGGALVPHADVVGVLDAFLAADVHDVQFVGTPPPLPGRP